MASDRLTEQQVSDSFHSFLKNALAQARAERLLDDQLLASAEADLMICGPALCLFFAALRSSTSPPSVPLPRSGAAPVVLSSQTCPPEFVNFFSLWSTSVQPIQSLTAPQQHDLARVICDRPPLSSSPHPATGRIASDLRAVAIEISQRRTFQNRYASDLQAVLDTNDSAGSVHRAPSKAAFVPPPAYGGFAETFDTKQPSLGRNDTLRPHSSPVPSTSRSPSRSSVSSSRSGARSPSILTEDDPVIDTIRETLYAALGDILSLSSALRPLLSTDPTRVYFSSVALAILDVAQNSVLPNGDVRGVLGQLVELDTCPNQLKPFMRELDGISRRAHEIADEDDARAMELLSQGRDDELTGPTRMDRLKQMLEKGVGYEETTRRDANGQLVRQDSGRVSPNGSTIHLANRINALSLNMTRLPAFRERQGDVFRILAGVR